MGFFLAILTVAAIGLIAIVGVAIIPISMIATSLYLFWKAAGYKEDLEKEYEKYKENRRKDFCESLEYTPHPYGIKVPTWFDQEKYNVSVIKNINKDMTIDGLDKIDTIERGYFITAFYEIPSNPEEACYTTSEHLNKNIYSLIKDFGILLAKLYKSNPDDDELKRYIQKVHNLDFIDWVDLEDPRYKTDILECKYLTLEEFEKIMPPDIRQQAKDAMLAATILSIVGVIFLVFFTFPIFSSM